MRLQDLNWMDVERYLQRDNRIILVTGATEQHAYLSLLTDVLIPQRIADAVAQQTGVLVAPPLNFGYSRYFNEFPGTISITPQTFSLVLMEVFESLLHQGFYRFLVLNGHGGNRIPERMADFQEEGLIRLLWFDWWRGEAATAFAEQRGLQVDHANWGENFRFNRVADSPEESKPPVNLDLTELGQPVRQIAGDGNFGGPYQLDDQEMDVLFEAVVAEAIALVDVLQD